MMEKKKLGCLLWIFYILRPLGVNGIKNEFMWGCASAAYQYEGATFEDGRGSCIWDNFAKEPGKIFNNENANVADDSYHRFAEDLGILKSMGLKNYRMSISWTRIFPTGKDPLNNKGIDHYNKVFDLMKELEIEPVVTLFHWDSPSALEEEYVGWLSSAIQSDFVHYADTCFKYFGDRVKYWATINEPWTFCMNGYVVGSFAPGRCSNRTQCAYGNSSTEGYICGHNMINAHALAVDVYRKKYQSKQKGVIGIVLNHDWSEPLTSAQSDVDAAQRANEFKISWFADPLMLGEYPSIMRVNVGERLPEFTSEQTKLVKGSWDVFYINHYTSMYYSSAPLNPAMGWEGDQGTYSTPYNAEGMLIGPRGDSAWLYVVPWGIQKVLEFNHQRYQHIDFSSIKPHNAVSPSKFHFIITENGFSVMNENFMSLSEILNDTTRIDYYQRYIHHVYLAIVESGVDVRGYFAWSLLDNFEWNMAYSNRFGLNYVNYTSLVRIPKRSAGWYRDYVTTNKYFGGRSRYREDAEETRDNHTDNLLRSSSSGVNLMMIILILTAAVFFVAIIISQKQSPHHGGKSVYIELDQSIRGNSLKGEGDGNDREFTIEEEDDEDDDDDIDI